MSLKYIRDYYGVPAFRGQRVRYSCKNGPTYTGTITSSSGAHLRIKMDGNPRSRPALFHPTWNLEYIN